MAKKDHGDKTEAELIAEVQDLDRQIEALRDEKRERNVALSELVIAKQNADIVAQLERQTGQSINALAKAARAEMSTVANEPTN